MIKTVKYSNLQYVQDLWYYIKPYKVEFFVGVFIRLTSDIAKLYPAWAISRIVQTLSTEGLKNYHSLITICIIYGVLAIYIGFSHNLCKYYGYQVAEKASLDLYKKTLKHIFKLDFAWQEKENSGNKLKRIDKGTDGVNISIRRLFNVLIEVGVNTVGIVILFFSLNKILSLSLIVYMIVFYIVGTKLLKKAIIQEKVVSKASENLEGLAFESLNNIHTIKSLAIDSGVVIMVRKQAKILLHKIKRRIFLYQAQGILLNSYASMYKYIVVIVLTIGVIQNRSEIGLLILFVGLFDQVDTSIGELTDVTQELAMAKIWISRTRAILDTKPTIENSDKIKNQYVYPKDWNTLTVRNINFSYQKKSALTNVSFTIKRNEKVGIVGLSGAGKSTLFKLFLDLYENYDGDILFDGIPLKKIQRQTYIDHVGVVLQDTELFNMSLKENIEIASIGNKKNLDAFSEVIAMAHLEEVVEKLSEGVDTVVGEKGVRLSGGQRQRVGIARALYRQPDILLLDEATSHLDAHSEKEIQKVILENVNQFTTVVIAHRLSTIKAMDKIIVLQAGKVVEEGSFEKLLAKNGDFAKMWQDQKI